MTGLRDTGQAPRTTQREPVVRDGSLITIHCPECQQLGTHVGTCSWSQARSGRVWTFRAIAIDIQLPASRCTCFNRDTLTAACPVHGSNVVTS